MLLLCAVATLAVARLPAEPLMRDETHHDGAIIHVVPGDSLQRAQAQARAAMRAADAAGRVVIALASGTHPLIDGPIVLSDEDSGIEWRGAAGGGAVISAGVALPRSAFAPVPADDPVLVRLPGGSQQVLRADISAYRNAIELPEDHRSPMELHTSNGMALTVARWPSLTDSTATDGWATATAAPSDTTFRFNKTASYRQPQNATGTVAHGYWSIDYLDSSVSLQSLDGGLATMTNNKTTVKPPARFFLLNQPEWLDAAGEYWIDPQTAMLYLRPPTVGAQDFVLSVGSGIFELQGASNSVSFHSLTLIAARETAIRCGASLGAGAFRDCQARNVVVSNCTIWGMGDGAIAVAVSPNAGAGLGWQVHGCNISSTGTIAIGLHGGDASTLQSSGHVVANTTVKHYGRLSYGFSPAIEISGVGTRVINNELSHGNGQALMWSGNNHVIEANVIHDACLETFDCGAVYESQRNWVDRGTVLRRNYIFNVGRVSSICNAHTSNGRHALYMDALSMGFTATDNILVEVCFRVIL